MARHPFRIACMVVMISSASSFDGRAQVERPETPGSAVEASRPTIDFDRDIRPILSNKCFSCHGPDAEQRQSGLRLDIREEALQPADSGKPAIEPGNPDESPLIRRITSRREGFVMPPPESNKVLTAAEKERLRAWIEQGAGYQQHWSFRPIVRPDPPKGGDPGWARNGIDRFILARLEAEGLRPSPEADRVTLIRRLTLDLTGLPPTPAEVDAFLADDRPGAYEALVDRLLASPHFGERMALEWLDAARFADTHGYHIDSGRDMTKWREWVIDAFNDNKPFDRFTVEQLAGDLLPEATIEQKVASGFNRNHMINFEGGAIPEEYQTAYIVDRVNTTATVWMGLTIACAQCHDHKFDPVTQKEYYQLYAFFNNVPEKGLDGLKGNAEPMLRVPDARQERALARLTTSIREVEGQLDGPRPEVDEAQARWESEAAAGLGTRWVKLDPDEVRSAGESKLVKEKDGSIVARGENPGTDTYVITARTALEGITAIRLEALVDDRIANPGPGRSRNGNIVLTDVRLTAGPPSDPAAAAPLVLKAASADFSQRDFPVALAIDDKPDTGWAILPEVGKPHVAVFEVDRPADGADDGGTLLTVTLDFRSRFEGHQLAKFRLSVTDASVPQAASTLPEAIAKILATEPGGRTAEQTAELRTYYRKTISPECRALGEELARLKLERADLEKQIPTAMVMQEMPQPRDTFMLERGQYDKHGEKVAAALPSFLPPLPDGAPGNRLGLARWLVDPSHPLTARVIVNRYWQMVFGTGLVKTSEDFGSQGEPPSHPELLDWLAAEFQDPTCPDPRGAPRTPWDIKGMLRLIVTSSAYRQASATTSALAAKDPENRLLARGPRFRLQAEFIRDQALTVGGLIRHRIGGRSVSPYQPAGLWEELMSREDGARFSAQTYKQDHGDDLYRRTLYTFWKRTSPPPTLATFDAPDRETCTVRRARTNTPLQALILLNDPTYVESSRKLAERMMTEAGPSADDRITLAFRLATARRPRPAELAVLREVFADQLASFRRDTEAASKLLKVGEAPRDESLDVAEAAAWTVVASMILNLDETVTKG